MTSAVGLLGQSGNQADVTDNKELLVALSQVEANAGFVKLLDANGREIGTTESAALRVSGDELEFVDQVDGSAVNTNKWLQSTSGMTIAQASGFITLNSGAATTANAYAILTSIINFPMYGPAPLELSMRIKPAIIAQSNTTMEMGIGTVATNAAPSDGAFLRWNASGEFRAIVNNGGVETSSVALAMPSTNVGALFTITIVEDLVRFSLNDELLTDVAIPAAQAYPTNSGRMPVFLRVYNGASTPSQAPVLNLGQLIVNQQDLSKGRSWGATLSGLGQGNYQLPSPTFTQSANHANSTSPSSASLSNTAAGYTTLGGRFQFASPAAATTDYALFGFQVPANYRLVLSRISISTGVTGAAIGTATILDWSIGVNASAVSLATADAAGVWAPRRIPLGMQGFLASAGIGTIAADLTRNFDTPLVIDSGRFLHIIVQMPSGTNTGSLVFRGDAFVNGYFE